MKKFISMFLAVAMCMSLCVNFAFASNLEITKNEPELYLIETNEETIQVDDGEGNLVDVTIIENIYSSNKNAVTQSLTPTEELGERRSYTIRISNLAMGAPGVVTGVSTLAELKVAEKAAEIVSKAVAAKLGANFLPGVNIASWLLTIVSFVNAACGYNGIEVEIELEYKGIFWHRENRYTYGWYPDGVNVCAY